MSTDFDYPTAVATAQNAAAAYYRGDETSAMTDAEYDVLLEAIQAFEQSHPDKVIEHSLFTAVAAGTIEVTISHRYRLADSAQAHRDLQGRKTIGSVVLIP